MELVIIAVLFIGMAWFMNSRTRKQQAEAMRFRDNLQPGQEVMTIGRMFGTVVDVDGTRITLELSDGVIGVWDKDGIARLVEPPLDDDEDELDDDEYDDDEDDQYEDDDEYDDDELDADLDDLDAELDTHAADETPVDDEPVAGAVVSGAVVSGPVVADAKTEEDWSGVDVPDDASSLTDPDTDENPPR